MNILVISEVFWPESFIINDLVGEWKKLGHKVDILTQYPSYPESYVFEGYTNKDEMIEQWQGSKIFRFKVIEGYKDSKVKKFANYLFFIIKGKKMISKILIDGGYDRVFISQTGPLTVALPAVLNKKQFDKPIFIWTFDIWPDVVYQYGVPKIKLIEYLLSKFIKYVYNHCDKIFISSQGFAKTINKYIDKPTIYTPNWKQFSLQVKSSLCLPKDKINFTFAGNISLYQNLLICVIGFVKANISNAVFNIVGNGSAIKELVDYITLNKVTNVILHGRKPSQEIDDILCQSDILVLSLINNPSIEKTEPLKLQSYLSAGKPIFGVLNGSCKEIIEKNRIGFCAKPNDVDSIAEGFSKIISLDNEQKKQIKANAEELLNTRFNREKIIQRITKEISPP